MTEGCCDNAGSLDGCADIVGSFDGAAEGGQSSSASELIRIVMKEGKPCLLETKKTRRLVSNEPGKVKYSRTFVANGVATDPDLTRAIGIHLSDNASYIVFVEENETIAIGGPTQRGSERPINIFWI